MFVGIQSARYISINARSGCQFKGRELFPKERETRLPYLSLKTLSALTFTIASTLSNGYVHVNAFNAWLKYWSWHLVTGSRHGVNYIEMY